MTLKHTKPMVKQRERRFVLPDAPPRGPDDMTTLKHLGNTGNILDLVDYFGNRETTIVRGDMYVARVERQPTPGRRIPDLLIAFNVAPDLFDETNGYVISEQGKPPDFVMEIGSRTTGHMDVGAKRDDYASLGIPEYWRFDETGGRFQGAPLAGDRLVDGEYEPIAIETLEEGVYQGYSPMLGLDIRWTWGELAWYDPRTGEPIPSKASERRAKEQERRARLAAEAQAREAQARIRELEEQLRQAQQRD